MSQYWHWLSLQGQEHLSCPEGQGVCVCDRLLAVQIISATGAKGPEISKITGELVKWQLARPDATQQDAEAWLSKLKAG